MGYKNCKKSNFSIRYTSRLNTFHTHIIYMERERERERESTIGAMSRECYEVFRCWGLFCCGSDSVFSLIYMLICIHSRSPLGREYTRVCRFFLKAGVFEMNLTCAVTVVKVKQFLQDNIICHNLPNLN